MDSVVPSKLNVGSEGRVKVPTDVRFNSQPLKEIMFTTFSKSMFSLSRYQNDPLSLTHMRPPINFTLKLYFPLYRAAATKVSLSLSTTRWGLEGNEIYSSK